MADVTMVKYAPMGDPVEVRIHSYELTLRLADAAQIQIDNVRMKKNRNEEAVSGRFLIQVWAREVNIMKKQMSIPFLTVSFLPLRWQGNQNCGKTTLFNQLTGSSQHVGNFPGVTVDRKDGIIRGKKNTLVTDLCREFIPCPPIPARKS